MCNAHVTSPRSLRARWVFPVAGPPLRDSAVTISQGRIIAVGSPPNNVPIEDLGQVAIVPGLVNAHTHLEFSDLSSPIGLPGIGLVEWLGSVIRHRASMPAQSRSSVEMGLRESLGYGVTTIGEIAQPGGTSDPYLASSCEGTIFLELIAPRVERIEAVLESAGKHLLEAKRAVAEGDLADHEYVVPASGFKASNTTRMWRPGLSPHAPYTAHPELLNRAVELSIEHAIPLAMHLAESPEEIELLRDGCGPFRELLESRSVWDPTARSRGASAVGRASRAGLRPSGVGDSRQLPRRRRDRLPWPAAATDGRGLLSADPRSVRSCPLSAGEVVGRRRDRGPGHRQPGLRSGPQPLGRDAARGPRVSRHEPRDDSADGHAGRGAGIGS